MIPESARLLKIIGPLNVGMLIIVAIAAIVIFVDRHAVIGYELRLRGLNRRFAGYGGVNLDAQTMGVMFASGAIAGLVGAIIVLGSEFRFIDGALEIPNYAYIKLNDQQINLQTLKFNGNCVISKIGNCVS